MSIRFGSVCSGIEAASVAWPFWDAAWFSEIEPFPCAVLKHHYPDVPNHGDMTTLPDRILSGEVEAPDVFCGGTPCQAFSVAGNRKSLDDARGNLSLTFCEIADAIDSVRYVRGFKPAIIFWENVPGVLNTTDNAFGCFLAKLAGESCELQPPGGRWTDAGCLYGPRRTVAWRVLDAQYFGLAQRRRRIFVCATQHGAGTINPSEILFEFDSLRRDSAPSRQAGQAVAADASVCFEPRSPDGHARVIGDIAPCLNTMGGGQREPCVVTAPPHAFKVRGGCEGGGKGYLGMDEQVFTITTGHDQQVAIPINTQIATRHKAMGRGTGFGVGDDGDPAYTLQAAHSHAVAIPSQTRYIVRRLTPTECERLQGFPPVIEITRIIGCIDRQSKTVRVEMQCHRLQSSAWSAAESEYLRFASAAGPVSCTNQVCQGPLVALYAQANFAGLNLVLRKNQSAKQLYANNAEINDWSRIHIQKENSVASLVPHLEKLAKETTNGKVASHQPILLSLTDQHGSQSVATFGGEITDIAGDANSDVSVEKSTISQLGRVTPICDSQTAISLCSVIRATSSFIQSETQMENFCIDLVLERDYTNIPWRKKPEAPDGPRYKALGNSWAVPVVRWIGERINAWL